MVDPPRPSERAEAETHDRWLCKRLDTVVPMLMERHGIDAWVVAGREYNEDPVLTTMLPATWISARRRTILLFTHRGRQRCAVSRYDVADLFAARWDPEAQPDQWAALADLLTESDPASIAVDVDPVFALADGMSKSEHDALFAALPLELRSRLVSGRPLAIGWLETRIAEEAAALAEACRIAHGFIRRGLSDEAITPGVTTTHDLEWWFRDLAAAHHLPCWFHPTVSVQRTATTPREGFSSHPGDTVIEPGDLVHVDFGIVYHGLHTDQQQHAYVLRSGEHQAPDGLTAALGLGNRAQDLLMAAFVEGRSGNEVLREARRACTANGLDATIYSHPIGVHGHAAGPTIGLWDRQEGVPGVGDHPLYPDTAYSIELNVATTIPEWNNEPVHVMLEEDAFFDGNTVEFLDGRQTDLWLIG